MWWWGGGGGVDILWNRAMRPALLYGSEIVIYSKAWIKSTGSGTKPGSSMCDRDRPESNQNRTKRGTGVAENGM